MKNMKYAGYMILMFLTVLSVAAPAQESSEEGLQWSGYFENQAFVQYNMKDDQYFLMDYNKLRLDMSFEASESLTFNADIIFRTYHGTTSLDILDFMPERISSLISPEIAPYLRMDLEDDYYVNDAYITVYLEGLTIRIGKQQLPWGTGYTWNPTDNFNVKNQLDPTYEKEGVNALKVEIPLGLDGNITAIAANRDGIDEPNYAFKIMKNIAGFDVSVSYQILSELNADMTTLFSLEQNRQIAGFDFTGQIFDIGVWGEGIYNWPDETNMFNDEWIEYIFGADYTFENGLYVMAEYLYNERGIKDSGSYSAGDFLQLFFGEISNIGTDYLSTGLSYPISDLINLQLFTIWNLRDNSWVAVPWLTFDAAENLEVHVAANLFLGDDGTEYGEYPVGGFVRVRIYF